MTTREDVLRYFAGRHAAGILHVAEHFDLSHKAAAKHVARLWTEQLVECTIARPRGTRFRLGPYEQLEDLRFQLTARGRARLAYYDRQRRAAAGELPLS